MSLTTFFQFTHTSYLPLPSAKVQYAHSLDSQASAPETADQIQQRGMKTAIRMLHEPETVIALNPLVQHYSVLNPTDPSTDKRLVNLEKLAPEFNVTLAPTPDCSTFKDSETGQFVHYEIVDKFEFLGGLTSKLMTYRACFRPLYDPGLSTLPASFGRESIGLETIADPGNGVALLGKWVVSTDEQRPGSLVLTETVQVHCNVFLCWYVRGQLRQAHSQLHKEFGRQFCERMVQGDPMKGNDSKAGKSWKETEDERRSLSRAGTGSASVSRVGTDELR